MADKIKTLIAVRIDISMEKYRNIPEEVIYYRLQPIDSWYKWMWYFEYLTALVQTRHPRRKVTLTMCNVNYLDKDIYIAKKRENLIIQRQRKLDKLISQPVEDDLFGFTSRENLDKIELVKKELKELEDGAVNFYVPQEYVNKIKKWAYA